jgi:hypothetical protein
MDARALEAQIRKAFPERRVSGPIALGSYDDCEALRLMLENATWIEIPAEFVTAHDGSLPLLTDDAYRAFLPAWLLQAAREPSEGVAGMLLVNLRHEPRTAGFTPDQALTIIDVARFITFSSIWGPTDPVNVDSLAEIRTVWGQVAA